ncbi:MAG: LolA family protein [Bryobacteraceae bacterium]
MIRLLVFTLAAVLVRADSLPAILARMDQASKNFHSVSANIHKVDYTAVIDETNPEDGTLRLKRVKGQLFGVIAFTGTDSRTIGFKGHTVEIYYPKANNVQKIDISKYTSTINQFMLLAFGTSGRQLSDAYDIAPKGTETIDGKSCTHLDLTPKSADMRKIVSKLELWIPEGESNPIRIKATEPSRNTIVFTYSDVKINPSVPDKDFELKLPPGVKTLPR